MFISFHNCKRGNLFSGRIEGRNAFEAAVLFIVLFRILFFIDVSIKLRIYIGIIVILPLTILAVVGVNGEVCFLSLFSLYAL